MNELRWILTGFAIVLLACIYLWGRRGARMIASEDAVVRVRPEPALHATRRPGSLAAWEPPLESHDPRDHNEAVITRHPTCVPIDRLVLAQRRTRSGSLQLRVAAGHMARTC